MIQAIVDIVPSPPVAQPMRIPKMLYPELYESSIAPKNKLERDMYTCDASASSHIVAFVSKMFAVPQAELPERKKRSLTAEEMRAHAKEAKAVRLKDEEETGNGTDNPESTSIPAAPDSVDKDDADSIEGLKDADETLLGFARLYSGTIRNGSTISCVLPKYSNALEQGHPRNRRHIIEATVEGLYTMMGRELVAVDCVRAGNVFAIKGLEGKVWRSATLCAAGVGAQATPDEKWAINLGGVNLQVYNFFMKICLMLTHTQRRHPSSVLLSSQPSLLICQNLYAA